MYRHASQSYGSFAIVPIIKITALVVMAMTSMFIMGVAMDFGLHDSGVGRTIEGGGPILSTIICRPELHSATTREQYDEFHSGMEQFGLAREISRDGKTFHLPSGEYIGVNVTSSFNLLALKIDALAMRITGNRCKLTFVRVSDPSDVYIYGLEEDVSLTSALANMFAASSSGPKYSALSALAELGSNQNTLPVPSGLASFLAELSRKG